METRCLTTEELQKEIQKQPELLIYEISVKEINENKKRNENEQEDQEKQEESEKEKRIKEEFEYLLKDELPDKLPPDRGLNHYIDLQGRIPKSAPRGFKLSEAEYEFMEKYVRGLLEKGLIQPCLATLR